MTASLPNPVRELIDAVNDGDTERFLAAFAAEGTVDDWGREFHGREGIRGWSDRELIGKHTTLTVTDVRVDSDTVVVIADVGGDGFNGPSTFTYTIDDDAVTRMAITE